MPNYEMSGLSAADFARIAGSVQEAPLRLKFLKPAAFSLPDSDTTNITKIDDGTYHDPPNTANLAYEKVIVDDHAGHNRTIILHSVDLDDADSVVSVINHDEGTVDEINSATSSGWSASYIFGPSRDIDFNSNTNELAIMVYRNDHLATLFVINLQKYIGELTACNQLAENPEYLNCTIMEHTGDLAGYAMRFVRHYKNSWYCWIGDTYSGTIGRADFGYFTSSGTWTSMWTQHRAWSDPAPFFKNPTPVGALGVGAYGDPMCSLAAPRTMEITDDGELILGTMPAYSTEKYGNETTIIRIDLDSLQNMDNTTAGILATASVGAAFNGGPYTPGIKDSQTVTITAEEAGVDRIDQCCIYEIICSYTGGVAGSPVYNPGFYARGYVKTDVGTVSWRESDERYFVFSTDGVIEIGVLAYDTFSVSGGSKTISGNFKIRKFPNSLMDCVSVHSETPIKATADTTLPDVGDPEYAGGPDRAIVVDVAGTTTVPTNCFYSDKSGVYAFSVDDAAGVHQGLMQIRAGGTNFTHFMEADGLYDDFIREIKLIGSDTFLIVSGYVNPNWNNVVQVFNADLNTLTAVADSYTMTYQAGVTTAAVSVGYSSVRSSITLLTQNEAWIFSPNTGENWSRDVRVHWNGAQPDKDVYVLGDSEAIKDFQFSDDRGLASSSCSFTAHGDGFLPWKKSTENEDYNNPGAYSALLQYGTRIQIQRGIRQADGTWNWYDEAQVVVTELPENLERGIVNIPVQCEGLVAHLFTKAIYEYFHEPTRENMNWVLLTRILSTFPDAPADLHLGQDFGFYPDYAGDEDPGLRVTDWISFPPPEVEIDGESTLAYQIDYRRGLVRFAINQCDTEPPYFQIPTTIDANFWRYVPGTNEIEDIIWCICTHPNDVSAEKGGAGLNENYITDTRTTESLTLADDGLSVTFPRDNLYDAADVTIYRDGVLYDPANYTLTLRTGIAVFGADQTGHVFTSTYKHWTLQASGITAPPMQFTDRDDGTALDCIERACRATFSFNYIFKARRDGKFESDYYTQKTTADITITDDHIMLEKLIRDPADEDCYNAVISYGKYPEGELPNLCLGIVPSNDWVDISGFSWGHTLMLEAITDNDVFTQQSGGWGGNDGWGPIIVALQTTFLEDGAPAFTIDLGDNIEVDQIVFVRGEGRANESNIQTQSIWGSQTNPTPANPMPATWEQIVPPFETAPAMTMNFHAEQDWPKGRKWRYLCVNVHSIGLYTWENVDSQMSFAEFQVYESEFIRGYAQLQDVNPDADLWDYNGLIEKFGVLTLTARDGQPDETLVTQELADADAKAILEEVSRYVVTHDYTSAPLPGIDVLCTLNITNAILNTSLNFFIENRNFGQYSDRDSGNGVYVP